MLNTAVLRIPARFLGRLLAVSAFVFAGCTPQTKEGELPDTVSSVKEIHADATVKAVDLEKRLLTLQCADGAPFTVVVGDVVANLPQVKAGDTVKVAYVEAVVAALKKPGEPIDAPTVAAGIAGAELGQKPAGVLGQRITATVKIESVDTATNIVTFTRSDGSLRALKVRRPEFQEYLKRLKPGDQVEITYTEAVAVSVEASPAASK